MYISFDNIVITERSKQRKQWLEAMWSCKAFFIFIYHDRKVQGANTWPIWGREDPGGPHVGPMNYLGTFSQHQ